MRSIKYTTTTLFAIVARFAVIRRTLLTIGVTGCCVALGAGTASSRQAEVRLFANAGPYNLRAANSGKCLDVIGGPLATANATGIQQYDCLGTNQTNQLWAFAPTGDGSTYYVTAVHSGKCLDVRGGPTATANEAPLQQFDCLGYAQANQRWQAVATGDGTTYYLKAAHSRRCLDVLGGPPATANAAGIRQYDCLGYAQSNQRWYFTAGDAAPIAPDLDGDGYDFRHDCKDAASGINPGAPDPPGDGIDQNCDGHDTPTPGPPPPGGSGPQPPTGGSEPQPPTGGFGPQPPTGGSGSQGTAVGKARVLFVRIINVWTFRGRVARVRRLELRGGPRGTVVTTVCRGQGCPFARRTRRAPRGYVDLGRPFKRRHLTAGTVVHLRLHMPGLGRYLIRFQIRMGKLPRRTDYCPTGRSGKLRRCA